jgi:hypothetical protein
MATDCLVIALFIILLFAKYNSDWFVKSINNKANLNARFYPKAILYI